MATGSIDRKFYDAIVKFERSAEAQDVFYRVMEEETGKVLDNGHKETVREQILKVYGALFCEDTGLKEGTCAGLDDVINTADRLYIDSAKYDRDHWYRMKHHFPIIDEDNYDRFAALVIADLHSGPLHDAALHEGRMLVVGEPDPLHMTKQQRKTQKLKSVKLPKGDD